MRKLLLASTGDSTAQGMRLLFDDLSKIKMAYITTATKAASKLDYFEYNKSKLNETGIDYEEMDIEGKNEDEIRKMLEGKNVIYVEGGNVFYLLKVVRESGFDKVVGELIDNGVAYFGMSAGSYIACPTIEMGVWKNPKKRKFGVTNFTAMNLIPFLIFAHYTDDLKDVTREKLLKSKYPVRIIRDNQAILVEGDKVSFVGEGEEVKLK